MAVNPTCKRVDNSLHFPPSSCRSGFDFSLLFEELILGILPLGIFIVLACVQLWRDARRVRKVVVGSWPFWAKLVRDFFLLLLLLPWSRDADCCWSPQILWTALGVTQLVLTVLWALPLVTRTQASVAVNAVTIVGTLVLGALSYSEHNRSVRPSFVINLYLAVTLLFDIAKTRTLWLRDPGGINKSIAIVTSLGVGIKSLLFLLEALEKRRFLRPEYKGYSPEALAGIYNRSFFWWLNPLFKSGFSKILAVDDLFVLDKQLEAKRLHREVEAEWKKGMRLRIVRYACDMLIQSEPT